MDYGLTGKVAVVTGGTHGIGLGVALVLARHGCRLAVCSSTPGRVEAAARELDDLGVDNVAMAVDCTVRDELLGFARTVEERFGTAHILVNNVGGGGNWGKDQAEDTEDAIWMAVYEKNALSAIRMTNWAIPLMRRQKFGRVVTITSIYGREGFHLPWYTMAKTAQTSLMKSLSLRHELSRDGLTFNSVAPGGIMIPDTFWDREARHNPERFREYLDRECPNGRLGTPEEVGHLVAFLASDLASHINGVSIPVDGGQSRSLL